MNISIFNLNCWLFPTPLSTDCYLRLSHIVEMIKTRDPDIITLQEVWSNKYISYLKEKLSGYFFIYAQTTFYNQSGLVTILRQEPKDYKVNFFKLSPHHNFTEFFLHKGYITTDIELNGENWTVTNTHLYAAFTKKTEVIIENQFKELVSKMPNSKVVICGDLNLSEDKIQELGGEKLKRFCDSQNTSDINNPYAHARFNSWIIGNKSKKIDYMLYKNSTVIDSQYEIIKTPFVSDHYPMFAKANLP